VPCGAPERARRRRGRRPLSQTHVIAGSASARRRRSRGLWRSSRGNSELSGVPAAVRRKPRESLPARRSAERPWLGITVERNRRPRPPGAMTQGPEPHAARVLLHVLPCRVRPRRAGQAAQLVDRAVLMRGVGGGSGCGAGRKYLGTKAIRLTSGRTGRRTLVLRRATTGQPYFQ
jgi:hypothetical protein